MKLLFLTLALFLSCFFASAISLPVAPVTQTTYGDSSLAAHSSPPAGVPVKKLGFFGKLKGKLVNLWVKRELENASKPDAKSRTGLIALALLVGGALIIALGTAGVGMAMILGGLITAIVALTMKRDKRTSEEDQTKKGDKVRWGVVAAIVGGAVFIGLLIAYLSKGPHI